MVPPRGCDGAAVAHCLPVSETRKLASTLLEAPEAPTPPPQGLWRVWAVLAMIVGSLLFVYHGSVLIVWNTPRKAVGKTFHNQFMKYTKGRYYFRGTGSQQSWSMFAPNPNRYNNFVRVLVTTESGEMWDMDQDIYGKNRYPYLWYDRMGKINRRINGKAGYQRVYGAWVCRQWERHHGELPERVTFVRKFYRIPRPWDNTHRTGPLHLAYWPWEIPTREVVQEEVKCARTEHGQNPERLRERYGLEPAPEGFVKEPRIVTWWDQKERQREAEERKAEAKRRLEERMKAREAAEGGKAGPTASATRRDHDRAAAL